jgi:hypothetical protein
MSIEDDYFDVRSFVEGTEVEESFSRFAAYITEVEKENDQLRKRNRELENAMKVIMGLKDDNTP